MDFSVACTCQLEISWLAPELLLESNENLGIPASHPCSKPENWSTSPANTQAPKMKTLSTPAGHHWCTEACYCLLLAWVLGQPLASHRGQGGKATGIEGTPCAHNKLDEVTNLEGGHRPQACGKPPPTFVVVPASASMLSCKLLQQFLIATSHCSNHCLWAAGPQFLVI